MLQSRCILTATLLAAQVVPAPAQAPADRRVHLNQIQIIGTHNSYHAGIAPSEAKLWQAKHPQEYQELDYQHPHRRWHPRSAHQRHPTPGCHARLRRPNPQHGLPSRQGCSLARRLFRGASRQRGRSVQSHQCSHFLCSLAGAAELVAQNSARKQVCAIPHSPQYRAASRGRLALRNL
jgi:hypothetical protein